MRSQSSLNRLKARGFFEPKGPDSLREGGKFPGRFLLTVAECYSSGNCKSGDRCLRSVATIMEAGGRGRTRKNRSADPRELLA